MAEDLMDKVFSFFAGDGMSDEKQNMLKSIAKELSQSKYAKFFKVRTEEADPSFSSFLFSVYKVIYPIRIFMKDREKMAKLKHLVVESCINNSIKEVINRLDHSALDEKLKTVNGDELIKIIQSDTDKLISMFDNAKIKEVNHRYELVVSLEKFVNYNFPGFFKKFDPHFADGSFSFEPRFPSIKTILIIDQIGDFLSVSQSLKPEDDWNTLLNQIKLIDDQDLVIPEQFITVIQNIREVHASKILELMVQYTLRNPLWQWKHIQIHETIGEDWLETKKAESAAYIQKINMAKKNSQISALLKQIFESTDLVRLENYTVQLGEPFRRRRLEGFVYAEGLNYLKAFLDDFADKELKELCDILLIRGQWTNNQMAREMSEALHRITEANEPIAVLDEAMSEDGGDGSRLRAALLRIDRDPTQGRYINSIINKDNEEALSIINEAAQDLIIVGKHMKNLIEDVQKRHPELLVNWREINLASKEPIAQRMIAGFKKINFFIQLMHLCTQ